MCFPCSKSHRTFCEELSFSGVIGRACACSKYNFKPIGTMHFSDVYTYAAPFSSAADMPMRETFLLRVIKARLEETLQHELDDDTFLGIMDAAYSSNGSGPLPYGPQMGPQMSFRHYFEKMGYLTLVWDAAHLNSLLRICLITYSYETFD